MSPESLNDRVNRIYAAIEGVKERDLEKFPPKVIVGDKTVHIWQDFRGGATDAELSNALHSLIHNVAHLDDHLKRWAGKDKAARAKIDSALQSCQPFLILKDLSNIDKHGESTRPGAKVSWSGLSPRLGHLSRPLRLTTEAKAGSIAGISFTPDGRREVLGDAEVIVTAEVLDGNRNVVGDAHDLALEAVEVIEKLVAALGITPAPTT